MTASDKLKRKLERQQFICVGLDTDRNRIPGSLLSESDPVLIFNKRIIDATHEEAAAYKLNFAFYENEGSEGLRVLEETVKYIPDDVMIIGDAKRGDIGNTAKKYAEAVFNRLNFDAVTVNPYMGQDSVEPFLAYSEKLIFFLALTSNPGSMDFEKLRISDGDFLFQKVIKKVVEWNTRNNCALVFGATNPHELEDNIELFHGLTLLLPGIGAQGGSLEGIINIFKRHSYDSFLLNISRALIYADNSPRFAETTAGLLSSINNDIRSYLSK